VKYILEYVGWKWEGTDDAAGNGKEWRSCVAGCAEGTRRTTNN